MAALTLTRLEVTVLHMIAEGLPYAEIARRLNYTTSGITSIAARMVVKLRARNMPNAVMVASRAGILDGRPFLRHGDHAGYEQHVRRRIPICDACRDGERAYRAGQREAQQPREAARERA